MQKEPVGQIPDYYLEKELGLEYATKLLPTYPIPCNPWEATSAFESILQQERFFCFSSQKLVEMLIVTAYGFGHS